MIRTNVLVIGGGPAGSTAARFLAANGIDTILVERDLSYIKPCGGGIPSTGLQELDIAEEDVTKKKIKNMVIVSPKGERVEVELTGGHLCITERGSFDVKLREMAQKKGACIIEAEFLRFEGIDKNIVSVVKKRTTSEEFKIKSDYVIASDGITFRVGSSIKHDRPDCLYTISAHIKPPEPQKIEDFLGTSCLSLQNGGRGGGDACEFWFGSLHASSFYSWIFPSMGYASIGTGSSNVRELRNLLDRFIMRRFNMPLKDFESQNFLTKTRTFKIPQWHGTIFNIKNIIFAGDAAGTVMPITYEGIYYAMKSGEFAARAIIEGRPSVYKKLWNSRFKNRFLLMNKIKNYLFKSDENIEKFVVLHKRPEVQEIAMRLWLRKEQGGGALISYLKFFKHLG